MNTKELKARIKTLEGELIGIRAVAETELARGDRLRAENQKLRATIPPRPTDNRNRDQESWDHRFGFLANAPVSRAHTNTEKLSYHE